MRDVPDNGGQPSAQVFDAVTIGAAEAQPCLCTESSERHHAPSRRRMAQVGRGEGFDGKRCRRSLNRQCGHGSCSWAAAPRLPFYPEFKFGAYSDVSGVLNSDDTFQVTRGDYPGIPRKSYPCHTLELSAMFGTAVLTRSGIAHCPRHLSPRSTEGDGTRQQTRFLIFIVWEQKAKGTRRNG